MALTNEDLITQYRKKYAIPADVATLTVYRATSPSPEQTARTYITDDMNMMMWSTTMGPIEEIVIGDLDGDTHTILDADDVWTEWTGDE